MRLLITGGSSYLGHHLVPLAQKQGHTIAYSYFQNRPDLPGTPLQLDLRQADDVHNCVGQWRPEAVIHLAGSNRAADLPAVIVAGTRNLCAALTNRMRLVNLSTDVLFDGQQAPYKEEAQPNPLHEYGHAKAQAEQIAAAHPNQVTVRTSLIYGLELRDRGTEGFAARLARGESLTLFNNQWRNPVWAESLSLACLELLDHPYRGPLHVAGREDVDRASYSLALLDYWGIRTNGNVKVGRDETGRFPLDTRLDISRAQTLLNTPLPGFNEVLLRHKTSTA